jgi:hypothetical protein
LDDPLRFRGLWVAMVSKGVDCERQQARISPRLPEKDAADCGRCENFSVYLN